MVRHTVHLFRTEYRNVPLLQPLECLGTGHFVAVETVDVELLRTIVYLLDNMTLPDFFKKSFSHFIYRLNLFMQSMYASTEAVTMSVSAPKP